MRGRIDSMSGPASDTRPARASRRSTRRKEAARRDQRERLGVVALAVALVGSALAFGAQHTVVLVPAALLAAVAAVLLPPQRVPRLSWLCALLAGVSLVQLVPLPASLVAHLSPAGHAVWRGALSLVGEETRRFVPLSVDPSATALEVLKWAAYACVASAASGWRTQQSSAAVSVLVFAAPLAVAVVELGHGLFDISRIYGLYPPVDVSRWLRGPLVNGNHFAGYLNLGLFAGIGLWVSDRTPRLSWPIALGCPTLVAGVLLSNSRGGIACLVGGALLFALLTLRGRLLPSDRTRQVLGVVLAVGIALTMLVGGSRLLVPFADRDVQTKTRVWLWSLDFIRDFSWFGAGRGSFETAFLPYRRLLAGNWSTLFAHAENLPLEWAAEWGIPVTLAALGAFAWCLRTALRSARRDPNAAGLFAGVVALTVQNFVDFSLEVFAVAALAAVALVAADFPPAGSGKRSLRPVVPLAVATALAALLVVATGAVPPQSDRQKLAHEAAAKRKGPELAALGADVKATLLRHPGDAYAPLVGAVVAERSHRDPLKWLGRALERSPFEASAHLMLGRVLARHGARTQALIHLRYAVSYDATLRDEAFADAAHWVRTRADLTAAFPRDVPGSEHLGLFCPKLSGALRVDCSRELVDRSPSDATRQALATDLLEAWESKQPPCAGAAADDCEAELGALVAKLPTNEATMEWQLAVARARFLMLNHKPREAAQLLLRRCPTSAEAAPCWERALSVATLARDLPLLGEIAQRYAASHCTVPAGCAVAHETLANTYAELDAWGSALSQMNLALREDPSVDRWLHNADLALRSGAARSAAVAIERAEHAGTISGPQRARLDALRLKLLERD